jgi:hypothetical protein
VQGVLWVLALAASVEPSDAPLEWRASAGGQIDGDPHGTVDVGVRCGPWSLELLTDTIDARWQPEGEGHRSWVGLRLEALAAGLMFSPWTAGAPDPSRALFASYAGIDAGRIEYLAHGFYAGVEGSVRGYLFSRRSAATQIAAPAPTLVLSPQLRVGWWSEEAELVATGGADVEQRVTAPKLTAFARATPHAWLGSIAPLFELRAGWAEREDAITRTRLGGLNPYVVPLAGAAWAEWWVEDYAALRGGIDVRMLEAEFAWGLDVARFDGASAFGLFALFRRGFGPVEVDAVFGWAPEIPRQSGVPRVSGWLRVGAPWGPW